MFWLANTCAHTHTHTYILSLTQTYYYQEHLKNYLPTSVVEKWKNQNSPPQFFFLGCNIILWGNFLFFSFIFFFFLNFLMTKIKFLLISTVVLYLKMHYKIEEQNFNPPSYLIYINKSFKNYPKWLSLFEVMISACLYIVAYDSLHIHLYFQPFSDFEFSPHSF